MTNPPRGGSTGKNPETLLAAVLADSLETPTARFPASITSFDTLPPALPRPDGVVIGGDTMVSKFLSVHEPTRVSERGPVLPMRVGFRVLSRDTTVGFLHYRPISFADCPLRIQILTATGSLPVWDSQHRSCEGSRRDSTEVESSWSVASILGDSLKAGRYYVRSIVLLADKREIAFPLDTLFLTGKPSSPTTDQRALALSAQSYVAGKGPRQLRARVVMHNIGSQSVSISHGACTPNLRLYGDPTFKQKPVWDSGFRGPYVEPSHNPRQYACILILIGQVIPSHDSAVFNVGYPLGEVLADSLPAGRYFVEAVFGLHTGSVPKILTTHAGAVDLAAIPDTLPTARALNSLVFIGGSRVIRGSTRARDTVRVMVYIKNESAEMRDLQVVPDCPLYAGFYRSQPRFDLPARPPAFVRRQKCTGSRRTLSLAPQSSRVLGTDVPVSEIIGDAGPGLYWISAFFREPSVTISAGTVDLRR